MDLHCEKKEREFNYGLEKEEVENVGDREERRRDLINFYVTESTQKGFDLRVFLILFF